MSETGGGGGNGSKRPPGTNPGEVLHQRRSLPFSPMTMAVCGLLIIGTIGIGYFTLYAKAKPGTSPSVSKVASPGSSAEGSGQNK